MAGSIVICLWPLLLPRHHLDIDTIGVPENLSNAGFTSEVATRRLHDAILDVQHSARTTMAMTTVDVSQDLAAITVPKTGINLESIAATIGFVLPAWRDQISGEFTQSGSTLSLRLRLNGKSFFLDTAATSDPSTADMLIGTMTHGAGFEVVRATQPYVAVSALYGDGRHNDAAKVEYEVDDIIARRPAGDVNVQQAYNLKGLIEYDRHNYEKAEALFSRTKLAVAYSNLGMLYANEDSPQYNLDKAIGYYRQALRLDHTLSGPHEGLGSIYLLDRCDTIHAMDEFIRAKKLTPDASGPHIDLGNVYRNQQKLEEALAEYTTAMHLDPKNSVPHVLRGYVYENQNRLDDAIVEYTKAEYLDPTATDPQVALRSVYERQHRPEEAKANYHTVAHDARQTPCAMVLTDTH